MLSRTQLYFIFLLCWTRKSHSFIPSDGWRIVLDLGREAGTVMDWKGGKSDSRMPLVVKCDFERDGRLLPKVPFVSFTDSSGEVVKPVEKGVWELKDGRHLKFTMNFPKQNDVRIPANTEVVCEGFVYSIDEMKAFQEEYDHAREESLRAKTAMDKIIGVRNGPKKWNHDTERWEQPRVTEPILSQLRKGFDLWKAQQNEDRKNNARPKPQDLSYDCGELPGIDSDVFLGKNGRITVSGTFGRTVVGRWSAEPINDRPPTY